MIRVLNRPVDLPAVLMPCPKCGRGDLQWDGRWAWRCNSVRRWYDSMHQEHRCEYGFAFSGLFDNDDLDHMLAVGRPLAQLRLSLYAIELLHYRVIAFSWVRLPEIDALFTTLLDRADAAAEREELTRIIRRGLEPKGGAE